MTIVDEYVELINAIYDAKMKLSKNMKVDSNFKTRYLKKYDAILNRQYESLENLMIEITDNFFLKNS